MVEGEAHAGDVGQVRGDVAGTDLHLAVLHVLGVHEEDVFEHAELLEERSADEAVEVGPGDEAVAIGHARLVGRYPSEVESARRTLNRGTGSRTPLSRLSPAYE